jgi:hypothetical protein
MRRVKKFLIKIVSMINNSRLIFVLCFFLFSFFVLVPALTLNFVEKMLQQKEKLPKAGGRQESSFTDDGFALGLAYILRILDQNGNFDSLHWFESVNNHIEKRRQEGAALQANHQRTATSQSNDKKDKSQSKIVLTKSSEEEILQHQVMMKKLTNVQTEFDLFFYSFSGATIFFQDAGGAEANKQESEKKEGDAASPNSAPSASSSAPPAPSPDPSSIPVPPPLDEGYVSGAGAPPAPPMDSVVVIGEGAPPAPPPDF